MGSNTSKQTNETAVPVQSKDSEGNINSDPRSPTPEIIRTPLQGKPGEKHAITKNADLSKIFEQGCDDKLNNKTYPILSAVVKNRIQPFDPRSPTVEIERTPIVLPTNSEDSRKILRRDAITDYGTPSLKETPVDDLDNSYFEESHVPSEVIPKNLCEEFFDMTLEQVEPLGSSTASQDAIENNISKSDNKPTQLLETNFEYVEVDKKESLNDESNNSNTYEVLDIDPRSPSIGIERTPIVVVKGNDFHTNVEDLSDNVLIKALQDTNAQLRNTSNKAHNYNKEGLLIYEDESNATNNVTPRKSAPEGNTGSRTPLSCMKNKTDGTHVRSKSANTMLDPKSKVIPPSKRVSHIPRLKALIKPTQNVQHNSGSLKSLVAGDCENTPPQSHRDIWDKDTSVVL